MKRVAAVFAGMLLSATACLGQAAGAPDPLAPIAFLTGTWQAKTVGGQAGAAATGSYTFQPELNGHVLARHTVAADCHGPQDFDCKHGDLLYVYPEGGALRAIYFDTEGHVIHYVVTTPEPDTAVFVSDGAGPQFRLMYSRKGTVMSGKFQMRMPGQQEWRSYLEWTGEKR